MPLGLKALGGPMAAVQPQQGTTKEGEDKTRYTEDDIAAIMGFSHVKRGDFDIFWRQLLTLMTEWGYNRRIQIDTGVFLDVDNSTPGRGSPI